MFKNNYRPVALSNISKIYETLMFKQISEYFELIGISYLILCGLLKGLVLITKNRPLNFGAPLTTLSVILFVALR